MNTRRIQLAQCAILMTLVACAAGAPAMDDSQLDQLGTRYAAAWSSADPTQLATFYADDGALIVNGGRSSTGHAAITEKVTPES